GQAVLTVHLPEGARRAAFGLRLRAPQWTAKFHARTGRTDLEHPGGGWVSLPAREWKDGDRVVVRFDIPARLVRGEHGNAGRAALVWGPVVLAYDDKRHEGVPPRAAGLADEPGKPPFALASAPGEPVQFQATVRTIGERVRTGVFVPFAEAGS